MHQSRLLLTFITACISAQYINNQILQYPDLGPPPLSINCVFHFDTVTNTYDCVSSNTTVYDALSGFQSIYGSHVANHSSYDVSGFRVTAQICRYVPNGLGDLIPNLKKLEISYSGLLVFDHTDTYKMPHLQYVNLKGNRLTVIPTLVFNQNPDIIFLDFSDNYIKFVSSAALNDLRSIRYIDFSNNICVQNSHPTDNFREWDRELRRNCDINDKFMGVIDQVSRIADAMTSYGNHG